MVVKLRVISKSNELAENKICVKNNDLNEKK